MIPAVANFVFHRFGVPRDVALRRLTVSVVIIAGILLVLFSTVIIAMDAVFPGRGLTGTLAVGEVAPRDIHSPISRSYVSEIMTAQRREEARDAVPLVYNPPDLSVARVQTGLAARILDFIDNVRKDPYATNEQKISALQQITALRLDETAVAGPIATMSDEAWSAVRTEVLHLLEQVLQDSIRESELPGILERLPNQVSLRFDSKDVAIIVDIVSDLIRPNRTLNTPATEAARAAAQDAVPDQLSSFQRGQIVVSTGTMLEPSDIEALEQLGLLQPPDQRLPEILRALLASITVLVLYTLYLWRWRKPMLEYQPRLIGLLAMLFLIMLLGARLSVAGEFYLFPAGVLALLFVAIGGPDIALIGTLGYAFLVGLMADNGFEVASLVAAAGVMGALTLRRTERLNTYILAGLLVAVVNIAVLFIFNLAQEGITPEEWLEQIVYCILSGIITAAVSLVGLYLLGVLFNLPTVLRLTELSQPSHPLLQRLLREAPGTCQHSLQVANLCEQAAAAVGANASLVAVAALYHDIGKLHNPAFFTENQRSSENPHDRLNDPLKSARIIIDHVTVGEDMAFDHRLPHRIREFIREHHGTTLVKVFYQQAVINAGDDASKVNKAQFTYPGPKPQSKETGIMMLADSCEAALRSGNPQDREAIRTQVVKIFNYYRDAGELDDSGLTLKDLKRIERIFVDMIEATLHPRINYDAVITKARQTQAMRVVGLQHRSGEFPVSSDEVMPWTVNGHSTAGLSIPPDSAIVDDEDTSDDHARAWD
jgi:putative nucleotidyltransferase with HDIG domain